MDLPNESMSDAEREALIERFRRIGLRLDAEGRFWHQDAPVDHPGLERALHRWLDQLPDGRFIIRFDGQRYAYVDVEDAPYQVRTVLIDRAATGPEVTLLLSDDTEELLDYGSLRVGPQNALYCRVKEGRLEARFSRQAYYLLGELVEEHEGQFVLRAAGQLWPIGQRDEG